MSLLRCGLTEVGGTPNLLGPIKRGNLNTDWSETSIAKACQRFQKNTHGWGRGLEQVLLQPLRVDQHLGLGLDSKL